jgi:hypothetical protein
MIQHPVFDYELGEFAWCLHCERANRSEQWASNHWMCPTILCDGSPLDIRPWEDMQDLHPHFPDRPTPGSIYGLYGDTGS